MATHAVIMAGGAGTRFWPVSRSRTPKQLLALHTERTLIGETVARLAEFCPPERTWIVTGADQHAATVAAVPELPAENVIAEPARRDTAPCIGLAATLIERGDPDAAIAVLPADHVISPAAEFCATLARAVAAAGDDAIATIGIAPTHPATGYGYIERGAPLGDGVYAVRRFVEKPDVERARGFLASGDYYWNGGIFAFGAAHILGQIAAHLPDHHARLARIREAWGGPTRDAVLAEQFGAMTKISIDFGVMEKADKLVVVEARFDWDDVGSWSALERLLPASADGVVSRANHLAVDSRDVVVWSDDPGHLIGLVGVSDLIVVRTADATLVCHKSQAEQVKALVERARAEGKDAWLD